MLEKIRPIAIYLPQFHPIPENDEWWGKGFTEWTNVVKAKPRFKSHYQPHLPADLGFYDLRVPEVRQAQADMAREHGIYGFCYYHYWFNGRRILERPFNEVLQAGKPDFPFCLCWANENWTRAWDGSASQVLLEQKYSFADDEAHLQYLCREVFPDKRYIRVNGKPLFIVYRTQLFPDIKRTSEIWREVALKEGIGDIYLAKMESFGNADYPMGIGFDASIEFHPDWVNRPTYKFENLDRMLAKFKIKYRFAHDQHYDYKKFIDYSLTMALSKYKQFPGITPGWDNSPRRQKNAFIIKNSSPDVFRYWLTEVLKKYTPYSIEENFLFINAWNEWAEGNHLEPCQKWGKAYLEVVKTCFKEK